jgi:hypothetical protein
MRELKRAPELRQASVQLKNKEDALMKSYGFKATL